MTWNERITALLDISIGLNSLHNNGLIHQDFHSGNLSNVNMSVLNDMIIINSFKNSNVIYFE